jgi:hypothetical protein
MVMKLSGTVSDWENWMPWNVHVIHNRLQIHVHASIANKSLKLNTIAITIAALLHFS